MSQRISLNQDDFSKLVRGEIVTQGELTVALQDIGHCEIFNAIVDAINGTPPELQAHSFREDEEEVRRWIYGVTHGEPSQPGGFLEAFCVTVRRADDTNYVLLRPAILALKAKFPKYRFTGAL
jgi:hypothetical protein